MKPKRLIICLALLLSGHGHTALVYPKAPDGAREIVAKEIRGDYSFLNLKPNDDVAITHPHLWLGTGPKDVISGHLFPPVTSEKCWRYILMHRTNVVGVATIRETDSATGKRLKFGELGKTGGAAETLKALRIAEHWPELKAQDYEVRYLTVPGGFFGAVWLRGKTNDIIIPLPAYNRFNAYQPYSETEVVKVLTPEARRDIAMRAKLDKQRQENYSTYTKAMMDYEKAHGGNCGIISYYGTSAPSETVAPHVQTFTLMGMSSKCGKLEYKVKVTYEHNFDVVKQVEILKKTDG